MAVGKAIVAFEARDKQLQTVTKRSTRTLQRFGDKAVVAAKAVAVAFVAAGVAVGGALAYVIKQASDAQEITSKFKAVFKEQAGAGEAFAKNLGKALGRSRTTLMGFMATLQDTFVPLGFTRREGRKLSQTLTQLTLDLASFNNQAEPTVLRDLQSALVGNHETMRKYGVIITETTIGQELLRIGIKGGTKAATEQQKVTARLNLIFAGTTDAQGDCARTADDFANRMRRLKATFEEISITIGTKFLPAATKVVGKLTEMAEGLKNLNDVQLHEFIENMKLATVGMIGLYAGLKVGATLFPAVGAAVVVAIAPLAALAAAMVAVVVVMGGLIYYFNRQASASEALGNVYEAASKKMSAAAYELRDAEKALDMARDPQARIAALTKWIAAQDKSIAASEELQKQTDKTTAAYAFRSRMLKRLKNETYEYRTALLKLTQTERERAGYAKDLAAAIKEDEEVYKRLGDSIAAIERETAKLIGTETEEEKLRRRREEIITKEHIRVTTPEVMQWVDELIAAEDDLAATKKKAAEADEKAAKKRKEAAEYELKQTEAAAELEREMAESARRAAHVPVEAAEKRLKLAEEALAAEKEKEHVARWESLTGLGRRIQAAAASVKADPRYQAAVDTAKAALRNAIAAEKSQALLNEIEDILFKIETGLPLATTYGA